MLAALVVILGVATSGSGRAVSDLPSGGAVSTATSVGSTLTVPRPTGVAAGDVLIASLDARLPADAWIGAPSGWTLIRRDSSGPGYGWLTQALYYRDAGPAEPRR